MTSPDPDPQFIQVIKSGLAYWQQRTARTGESRLHELDHQRQNIHRLLQFGLQFPETWPGTTELLLDLFVLIERRGYLREGIGLYKTARDRCPPSDLLMQFHILNRLGQLYRASRQLQQAVATHEAAAQTANQLQDDQLLAQAYFNLSEDHRHLRHYDQVEEYGQAALRLLDQGDGNEKWLAGTLNTLGVAAWRKGDLNAAAAYLNRALPYWQRLDLPTELARTLSNLAAVYRLQKQYDASLRTYREAQTILAPTASEMDKIVVLIGLGGLFFAQKRYQEAEATFREADSEYLRRSGNFYYQAYVANNLGQALLKQGRLDEAEPYLCRSAEQWREANDDVMLANALTGLADLLIQKGQPSAAITHIDEALQLLSNHPNDTFARSLIENLQEKRCSLQTP